MKFEFGEIVRFNSHEDVYFDDHYESLGVVLAADDLFATVYFFLAGMAIKYPIQLIVRCDQRHEDKNLAVEHI